MNSLDWWLPDDSRKKWAMSKMSGSGGSQWSRGEIDNVVARVV